MCEQRSEAGERPDDREQTQPSEDHLVYATVYFTKVHSNVGVAQARRHKKVKKEEEAVVYDAVRLNHCAGPALRTRAAPTEPQELEERRDVIPHHFLSVDTDSYELSQRYRYQKLRPTIIALHALILSSYTWYKEDEDSPKASGHIFTITDLRPEHSGNYYCEAQNTRGRHKSTLNLTVLSGEPVMIMNTMRLTLMLLMLITLVGFSLWTRKKKTLSSNPEPKEAVEMMEVDSGPVYEDVTTAAQTEDSEEQEDLSASLLLLVSSQGSASRQLLVSSYIVVLQPISVGDSPAVQAASNASNMASRRDLPGALTSCVSAFGC
ncbi:hypothetical protein INR49_003392, partial [Caranx melampygus]